MQWKWQLTSMFVHTNTCRSIFRYTHIYIGMKPMVVKECNVWLAPMYIYIYILYFRSLLHKVMIICNSGATNVLFVTTGEPSVNQDTTAKYTRGLVDVITASLNHERCAGLRIIAICYISICTYTILNYQICHQMAVIDIDLLIWIRRAIYDCFQQ